MGSHILEFGKPVASQLMAYKLVAFCTPEVFFIGGL